jgi:hypothetical protein
MRAESCSKLSAPTFPLQRLNRVGAGFTDRRPVRGAVDAGTVSRVRGSPHCCWESRESAAAAVLATDAFPHPQAIGARGAAALEQPTQRCGVFVTFRDELRLPISLIGTCPSADSGEKARQAGV